jgi:hypothetical protein
MQNVRQTLIKAMREKLETSTASMPASMAIATPLGPLADAALEVLSGGLRIPTIPRYDPVLAAERRWYGAVSTADVDEGAQFPSVGATREGDSVVLHIRRGDLEFDVVMSLTDAADFGLTVAGTAYAEVAPVAMADQNAPERNSEAGA